MQNQIPINTFSIAKSSNMRVSERSGGSFSGMDSHDYDLEQTKIVSFELRNESTLKLKIVTEGGYEKNIYVRATNKNGIEELNIVLQQIEQYIDKPYGSLFYHRFSLYDKG